MRLPAQGRHLAGRAAEHGPGDPAEVVDPKGAAVGAHQQQRRALDRGDLHEVIAGLGRGEGDHLDGEPHRARRGGRRLDRLGLGLAFAPQVLPGALDGPQVSIRRFGNRALTGEDLVTRGAMPRPVLEVLRACVRCKLNVIVSGGTGSGKTTLLNVLSGFIPDGERIIIGKLAQMDSTTAIAAVEAAKVAWDCGNGLWPQMKMEDRIAAIQNLVAELKTISCT
jgi:hypothetical protein